MGSGKSSIATALSAQIGLPLYDMDQLVLANSGCSSISEIFEKHGEDRFRDLETAVASDLQQVQSGVISTGGGVVKRSENRALLCLPNTAVVFLRTSFESINRRIAQLQDRPLFRDRVQAEDLLRHRTPAYEAWATITVDTDDRTPAQICDAIIDLMASPAHG
jgi:shikimate kinase